MIYFVGDILHLVSYIKLLSILRYSNDINVSHSTQFLFTISKYLRYFYILNYQFSLYNTLMKLLLTGLATESLYLTPRNGNSYDLICYLFICISVGFLTDQYPFIHMLTPNTLEILWYSSYYIESVSILPQLFISQNVGYIKKSLADYIFCLGAYKLAYLIYWSTRKETHIVVFFSGLVQVILFTDFFYIYLTQKKTKNREEDSIILDV